MANYFTDSNSNWRELAKQAAMTAVNDLDVEKAFADQASGFVENKVGDLMKDEHRIGFEIVKKNDENTRMIGIYAFKVSNDLIFAPVFFINGEIKGPLLYRCDTKTFVPANKDWANYLIESLDRKEGTGRSRSRRGDAPPRVDMDRMAFRGKAMAKTASEAVEPGNKPVKEEKIKVDLKTVKEKQEISLKDAEIDKKTRSVGTQSSDSAIKNAALAEFGDDIERGIVSAIAESMPKMASGETVDGSLAEMLREPVFGKAAAAAVIAAAERSEEFASQLVRLYGNAENLFPDHYIVEPAMDKSASAESKLVIHYSIDDLEKSAAVSKEYFSQGFYIEDTRPSEGLSVVDENTGAYMQHVTEPGFYSILMEDGSYRDDVFVAKASRLKVEPRRNTTKEEYDCCCCSSRGRGNVDDSTGPRDLFRSYADDGNKQQHILVKDGKSMITDQDVWGIYSGSASELANDELRAENFYYIYIDNSQTVLGPIAVHSVKESDGNKYCKVADAGSWNYDIRSRRESNCAQLVVNKDLQKSDIEHLAFGSDAKFIRINATKVKSEFGPLSTMKVEIKEQQFGDDADYNVDKLFDTIMPASSLSDAIYDNFGLDSVKITFDGEKKAAYNIEANGRRSEDMNSVVMMVKLARDLNIHADTAFELMDKASDNGSVTFMLGLNKEASRLHLVDRPTFDEGFDSEFGLPTQPTKEYRLRIEGQQQFEPPSAIGDALNPTSPTGLPDSTVVATDPSDLQALADMYKVPHVFEHGVVGTLAETFNAMSMLDKYIPKIEDGVDALGRIKFLLHWCPNDFENSYGSDDMLNLEAEVDSNFTSQGALLLKLMKRSEKLRKQDGSTDAERDKG